VQRGTRREVTVGDPARGQRARDGLFEGARSPSPRVLSREPSMSPGMLDMVRPCQGKQHVYVKKMALHPRGGSSPWMTKAASRPQERKRRGILNSGPGSSRKTAKAPCARARKLQIPLRRGLPQRSPLQLQEWNHRYPAWSSSRHQSIRFCDVKPSCPQGSVHVRAKRTPQAREAGAHRCPRASGRRNTPPRRSRPVRAGGRSPPSGAWPQSARASSCTRRGPLPPR